MAAALERPASSVRGVVQRLLRVGLLQGPLEPGDDTPLRPTARLPLVVQQLGEVLDRAFVSRAAVRDALFVASVRDAAMAARLQRLFDSFYDLGWLFLHNWGATCHVAASLVAGALREQGVAARVACGSVAIEHAGRSFRVGRLGDVAAQQMDLHVFCIADERVLVDFGLGNVRRRFSRHYPWAVAVDLAPDGGRAAVIDTPRTGRVEWRTDWTVPEAGEQLAAAQEVAQRLLPRAISAPH
jgi:hypothetical protein